MQVQDILRDRKNPLFKHTLFISIPLMIENEIIGVLNINDNEKEFFNLFKNVNATYGHQKGDEILLDFASTMKTFCCSNDVAARYGGEEFVLVLPETKVKGAVYITERIREEMASQTFQHKGEQTVKAFITQDA